MTKLYCRNCTKLLGVSAQKNEAFHENYDKYLYCTECWVQEMEE